MDEIDTSDDDQLRAVVEVLPDPPRRRRKPLDTLMAVRREMTATYWEMKHDGLELDLGKARIYALGKVAETLKAEQQGMDAEVLALLRQVKERLK